MIKCLGQDVVLLLLLFVIIFPEKRFMYYLQPWCIAQIMPKITQIALNNIKGTKNKVKRENSSFRNVISN